MKALVLALGVIIALAYFPLAVACVAIILLVHHRKDIW